MSEYVQVGVTALRDPVTGDFMPSVPLYVRAEDQEKVEVPIFDDSLMRKMADKYKQYLEGCRRARKKTR